MNKKKHELFSNDCIIPPRLNKPHIVKVCGRWRVSKLSKIGWRRPGGGDLHDKAHAFARGLNN